LRVYIFLESFAIEVLQFASCCREHPFAVNFFFTHVEAREGSIIPPTGCIRHMETIQPGRL
jgi:hypothetical protein